MSTDARELFWSLARELQDRDPRVVESTIMGGRCLRVGKALGKPRNEVADWATDDPVRSKSGGGTTSGPLRPRPWRSRLGGRAGEDWLTPGSLDTTVWQSLPDAPYR